MGNLIYEISRVKTLMGLKEEKQVYNYVGTSNGTNSFTYKLDSEFKSKLGDDVILVDKSTGETHEFKVGKDIYKSRYRPNEVYSKKLKIDTATNITDNDCKKLNMGEFIDKMKGYSFKFNNTPLKTLWDENAKAPTETQKDKLKKGLTVLKTKGYLNDEKEEELEEEIINNNKFVFDENGNWLSINKITGNSSQFIDIIGKIIKVNFDDLEAKEIYCKIINNHNPNNVIDKEHKKYFEKKIDKLGIKWLNNQTDKIDYFSNKGKEVETRYINYLLSPYEYPNAKVLYEGGDGDLLDINLSIDLIVDFGPNSEFGVKTIQIKATKNAYEMMKVKYNNNSNYYKYIDWVVYPKPKGGWERVDLKESTE
jgi:hypothetical protein